MRHLPLAALLVAMAGCGSEDQPASPADEEQPAPAETAAQEEQLTAPTKEDQPAAPAETATLKGMRVMSAA